MQCKKNKSEAKSKPTEGFILKTLLCRMSISDNSNLCMAFCKDADVKLSFTQEKREVLMIKLGIV